MNRNLPELDQSHAHEFLTKIESFLIGFWLMTGVEVITIQLVDGISLSLEVLPSEKSYLMITFLKEFLKSRDFINDSMPSFCRICCNGYLKLITEEIIDIYPVWETKSYDGKGFIITGGPSLKIVKEDFLSTNFHLQEVFDSMLSRTASPQSFNSPVNDMLRLLNSKRSILFRIWRNSGCELQRSLSDNLPLQQHERQRALLRALVIATVAFFFFFTQTGSLPRQEEISPMIFLMIAFLLLSSEGADNKRETKKTEYDLIEKRILFGHLGLDTPSNNSLFRNISVLRRTKKRESEKELFRFST